MGLGLLRQWLRYPLCEIEHITARQAAIAAMLESPAELKGIIGKLDNICDIERILGRVAVGRATPRDLAALLRGMASIPLFLDQLESLPKAQEVAPELVAMRPFCGEQAKYLHSAILSDPAPHLREGGVICDGFDAELDRLRNLAVNSRTWLAEYQAKLSAESNIGSLKISYNKVFGYYIEVTHVHREKVPITWTRKQTTTNAERYITPELKEFEQEACRGRRIRRSRLEQQLFEQIRQSLLPYAVTTFQVSWRLELQVRVDVLSSLAMLAQERRYCRPSVVEERVAWRLSRGGIRCWISNWGVNLLLMMWHLGRRIRCN